jgi:hypothetical protein
VNKKQEGWSVEEQLAGKCLAKTQFGKMADALGVTLIPAGTPQAKGRVERLWDTLQGRLPTYLALEGITTMEQANAHAGQIMNWFNARFGHKVRIPPDLNTISGNT